MDKHHIYSVKKSKGNRAGAAGSLVQLQQPSEIDGAKVRRVSLVPTRAALVRWATLSKLVMNARSFNLTRRYATLMARRRLNSYGDTV